MAGKKNIKKKANKLIAVKRPINKKTAIGILAAVIILVVGIFAYYYMAAESSESYESAVEMLKQQYASLRSYPSDKLPPKSIVAEEGKDGWHIAFIQEGSGRPIISAKCFLVDNENNVLDMKNYEPLTGEDSTAKFSPIACAPETD